MIRQLTADDLQNKELLALGEKFFTDAKLPGEFIPGVFVATWSTLMRMTCGAIWTSVVDDRVVGAIGGVFHPDANDGKLVAQEMFWFMDPSYRSGFNAIKLFTAFENWAISRGATRIVMGCILGEYAKPLREFYTKMGYRPVDVSYFKEL